MSTVFAFGFADNGVSVCTDSEGLVKVLSYTNDAMPS